MFSFPREHRLRQKSEFRAGFAGAKVVCGELVVYAVPRSSDESHSQQPESRIGVIVSRKVHRKAHERNRVKRLLREAFRGEIQPESREKGIALDLIVIARQHAVGASLEQLTRSFRHCVERLRRHAEREQLKRA